MCAKISQIVFLAELTVFRLLTRFWKKCQKTHISASSVHKCHKSCSKPDLTVLRLITTVWAKMAENSYLREFIAQVSQIVFLAGLTILQLITTVWTKNFTKLISPRVLCTSVTNCILIWFDRFMAKYNRMKENVANFISPRVLCTSITNRVLTLFDRFTAYYYCMSKKFKKFHISTSSVHNYHKSCF